jgi:hypothetical protein
MTPSDLEEQELLGRARRGLSPGPVDAERVHAALRAALVHAPPDVDSPPGIDAPSLVAKGLAIPGWVSVVALSLGVATAAGGAGYYFGFRAGAASVVPERIVEVRLQPSAPPSELPAPVTPASAAPQASPSVVRNPPPVRISPSSVAAVPSAADAAALGEETRLVARVERALRDGNPRLALGLLGELDRTNPGGQLREERDAARVLGRCALATESTPELAQEFAKRYPGSAYLPRIREACGRTRP